MKKNLKLFCGQVPNFQKSRRGFNCDNHSKWLLLAVAWLLAGGPLNAQIPPSMAQSSFEPIYYNDRIVPTPKSADYGPWFDFGRTDSRSPFQLHIILGESPDPLDWKSVETIETRLRQLDFGRAVSVTVGRVDELWGRSREADLAILIGRVQNHSVIERFTRRSMDLDFNFPEGYRIASLAIDPVGPNTIMLIGSDPRGTYYAAQSLAQVLTTEAGHLAVRQIEVADWPSYRIRASGNDEKIPSAPIPSEALAWLSHVKLNAWAVGQSYHWPNNWRATPRNSLSALDRAVNEMPAEAIDLQFQVHPFGRANPTGQGDLSIRISEENDRQRLIELVFDRIRSGASQILLRADDFHELSEVDADKFASKAEAHVALIRDLHEAMSIEFPSAQLLFCPPYYHGAAAEAAPEMRRYLETIGRELPDDITILWTGHEVVSSSISQKELIDYSQMIQRYPLLWDNTVFREKTPFGYPYIYAWYMYDPINLDLPAKFAEITPGIRFNYGYDGSQMSRVANAILAEFLWNAENYDEDQALRHAIALIAGDDAVDTVLRCASAITEIFNLRHSPARTAVVAPVIDTEQFEAWIKELALQTDNRTLANELMDAWFTQASHADSLRNLASQFNQLRSKAFAVLRPGRDQWKLETEGEWEVTASDQLTFFEFPFETQSAAGAYAAASTKFPIPTSPTGRYYLSFLADDDYYATGEPPTAYPGYFYKQVLIDGMVVWESDAVGPTEPEIVQIDLTDEFAGKPQVQITLRTVDAQGVSNLGIQATFSPLFLNAEPQRDVPVIEPQSGTSAAPGMEVVTPVKSFFPAQYSIPFEASSRGSFFDELLGLYTWDM
jgi:hypothetical protein